MPTKYKPELDHKGLDWFAQSVRFDQELLAIESQICEKSGFDKEFDHLDRPKIIYEERSEFLKELSGGLLQAVAIRIDAGFKAPNKVASTLKAIEKDPALILSRDIEPEALGMLGGHYQRADEPLGTFWMDVDKGVGVPCADPERVRLAASRGILALKRVTKPGRLPHLVVDFLAVKGRELFLRFNDSVTRHSIATGSASQTEAGAFFEFLELWLTPLNQFFAGLHEPHLTTPISPASVARRAIALSQGQL
jgi:hypothetical protein